MTREDDNDRAHEALAKMIAGVDDRVEAHDALLGRNGEALRALVQDAVARAIVETASDPALWGAIRSAMVRQTKETAGGWLLSGASSIGTKLFWTLAIGAGLFLLGGWGLVVKVAKAITGP